MFLADTLSRAYLKDEGDDLIPDLAVNSITYLPMSPEKYSEFQRETQKDETLGLLQSVVKTGWPMTKNEVPQEIRTFWPFRDEISCNDGILYKSHKVIVPLALRQEMLNCIHSSHLGIVKCKSRARESLFWPGMATQIEEFVGKCGKCASTLNSNARQPLLETETPNRPWEIVSTDLFDFEGNTYIVSVDHYSKWPEMAKLDNLSAVNTITHLKSQFSRYGIPDKLISDNGPQYANARFNAFAKDYGFTHVTSSPTYPQSNGQAERTVQTVKNMLLKAGDPYKALMAYRNTAIEGIGLSPAQMFLGRRLKTDIPTTTPLLDSTNMGGIDIRERLKTRKVQQKVNFDCHAGPVLRELYPGENVVMKHNAGWLPAKVVKKHQAPRSYVMEAESGRKYRRNRLHIRPTPAINIPSKKDAAPAFDLDPPQSPSPTRKSPITREMPETSQAEGPSRPQGGQPRPPEGPPQMSPHTVVKTRLGRAINPRQRLDL